MARTATITDEKIVKQVSRRKRGFTAAELDIPTSRLQRVEGIEVIGTVKTGRRGRPAFLFGTSASQVISA